MLRKFSTRLLVLALTVACLQGCNRQRELTGEVFIVTNGGQNFKLGLVEIRAIPEADVQPFIAKRLKDAELQRPELEEAVTEAQEDYQQAKSNVRAANNDYRNAEFGEQMSALGTRFSREDTARDKLSALNDAEIKLGAISAPEFFFDGLPQAVASARTDSEGRFTITVPKSGKYAFAARAERKVFDRTEFYFWLVWVDAGEVTKVTLSNTNLMTAHSPDTVVGALNIVFTED